MSRTPIILIGRLPLDAELKLIAAGRVGTSGSRERRQAIDRAYAWIDDTYPEFVKLEVERGEDR